jgi:hypothetical protein
MQKSKIELRLEQLRRDASKLSKLSGLTHYTALDLQARRFGYAGWADLRQKWRKALEDPAPSPGSPLEQVAWATRQFLRKCEDSDIHWLCRGGSLWVRASDVRAGDLTELDFVVLGAASDSATVEEAKHQRLLLLSDLENFDTFFVFDGDTDDDGNALEPQPNVQIWYEPTVARTWLIELAEAHVTDGFYAQIEPVLPA